MKKYDLEGTLVKVYYNDVKEHVAHLTGICTFFSKDYIEVQEAHRRKPTGIPFYIRVEVQE